MERDVAGDMLLLLQITDSVFPIGAYAHSWGLETYVQRGIVTDGAGAWRFLEHAIAYPLTFTELLAMRLAFEAMSGGDVDATLSLEAELRAMRVPSEVRTGLEKMASRFAKTAVGLVGTEARERFSRYVTSAPAHLVAVAYGVYGACAGVEIEALLGCYLYSQASAIVANCVKTIPLSQTEGQHILRATAPHQRDAVARALAAPADLLGLSSPGLDVRCIEHEALYSRLYMS